MQRRDSVKDASHVFARSPGGAQWFDGDEWHDVPAQWRGGDEGVPDPVTINSDEYPAIATLIEAEGDFGAYLSIIGVDLKEYRRDLSHVGVRFGDVIVSIGLYEDEVEASEVALAADISVDDDEVDVDVEAVEGPWQYPDASV